MGAGREIHEALGQLERLGPASLSSPKMKWS
jgi:hypothetical protein